MEYMLLAPESGKTVVGTRNDVRSSFFGYVTLKTASRPWPVTHNTLLISRESSLTPGRVDARAASTVVC